MEWMPCQAIKPSFDKFDEFYCMGFSESKDFAAKLHTFKKQKYRGVGVGGGGGISVLN